MWWVILLLGGWTYQQIIVSNNLFFKILCGDCAVIVKFCAVIAIRGVAIGKQHPVLEINLSKLSS